MTHQKSNEGKVLDAVIKRIEERNGYARRYVVFPDKENRTDSEVELVCKIGNQLYAFEHTVIEPFSRHIQLQAQAPRLIKPIKDALDGKLPSTENFILYIPLKAMEGLKGRQLDEIQKIIVEWVKLVAPTLPIANFGRYVIPIKEIQLDGVPFKLSLSRSASLGGRHGRFDVRHSVSEDDLESARLERIGEAYTRKVPKIVKWRRECGARSILIFEENDIQLTNSQVVADALEQVERSANEMPDEIYLVTTSVDHLWCIWAMRVGDVGYYSLCRSDESMSEVSPSVLCDLTSR